MSKEKNKIRNILVEKYQFDEDYANSIDSLDHLKELLGECERVEDVLKNNPVDFTNMEGYIKENYEEEVSITPGDPGWSDYVMGLFVDDEIMEKDNNRYPTLKGLRRVFLSIYGPPTFSGIVDFKAPTDENSPGRAYANYEIVAGGSTYRGAAEAYPGNINGGYHVYPLAIAENRAEARAYRKALMLNVVTAEEIGNESSHFTSVLSSSGEFNEGESISDSQMTVIKNKCKELNIDLDRFLEVMKSELGATKLTRKVGLAAIKKISIMSNDNNQIPGDLR